MKYFILIIAVMFSAITFAQVDTLTVDTLSIATQLPLVETTTVVENVKTFPTFWLVLSSLFAVLLALFVDTSKYLLNKTWEFKKLYKTKLLPFSATVLVLIVVWLLLGWFAKLTFSSSIVLFGFAYAYVITNIIDQLLKAKTNQEPNIVFKDGDGVTESLYSSEAIKNWQNAYGGSVSTNMLNNEPNKTNSESYAKTTNATNTVHYTNEILPTTTTTLNEDVVEDLSEDKE